MPLASHRSRPNACFALWALSKGGYRKQRRWFCPYNKGNIRRTLILMKTHRQEHAIYIRYIL